METLMQTLTRTLCIGISFVLSGGMVSAADPVAEARIPAVGERAPDFSLKTLGGPEFRLSEALMQGPAVLVVLRGYPGYQCPLCSRQVGSLIGARKELASKKAKVILVYPGGVSDLDAKAKEFLGKTELPENFVLALDPDYQFTNAYGLRWDAPKETAYPSTFVIDSNGKVRLAVVSQSHGGRAETKKVLSALD